MSWVPPGWLSGLGWMGLGIVLGLARRLSFKLFRVTHWWCLCTGQSRHSDVCEGFRERITRQGVPLFFLLSGKEPVGRTSPGCCDITRQVLQAILLHETSAHVTSSVTSSAHCLITALPAGDNGISQTKGQLLQPPLTPTAELYFLL